MRETGLTDIPGVGPTRARILLRRFGSFSGVAAADPAMLAEAVGPATARAVRLYLDEVRNAEPAREESAVAEGEPAATSRSA